MSEVITFIKSYSLAEWSGVVGFMVDVVNYLLLSAKIIGAETRLFFINNIIGSLLVLYSLTVQFNFASILTHIFWIAISFYGLILRWNTIESQKKSSSVA